MKATITKNVPWMPAKIDDLTSKAMLVFVKIGRWGGTGKDPEVTGGVLNRAGAASDSGTWSTRFIPLDVLKPIGHVKSMAMKYYAEMTLPWDDNGSRILPAESFMKFTENMRELKDEYEKAVESFLVIYPTLVQAAKNRLGDLYRPERFIPVEEVRERYSWTMNFIPLPSANDFRVQLGTDETDMIKANIEKNTETMLKNSMEDVWNRLFKVVEKVAGSLENKDKKFRDSLIGNVRDLCKILPSLNITNDPELEKMRKDIVRKISKKKAGTLRTDQTERKKTADDARKLMNQMDSILKPK